MVASLKTVTVAEIQELDRWAIEKIGIPSLALMENAGRAAAEEIIKKLKRLKDPLVAVVCGTGNNGGDGFVIARCLFSRGYNPKVFLIGILEEIKTDALTNYRAARNLGIPVTPVDGSNPAFEKSIRSADLIVDAVFGVGLNRPVFEPHYGIINTINTSGAYVVAVDIPSGLDGTTGEIYGICVKADLTIAFSRLKKGFLKKQGPLYTGRQEVVDIGIPSKVKRRKHV